VGGASGGGTAGTGGATAGTHGGIGGATAGTGGVGGAGGAGGASGSTNGGASGGGAAGANGGAGAAGAAGANGGSNAGGAGGAAGGMSAGGAAGSTSVGGAAGASGGTSAGGVAGAAGGTSAGGAAGAGGACTTVGDSCVLAATSGNGIVDATCACAPCPSDDTTGDAACAAVYGDGSLCISQSGTNACLVASGSALCRSTSGTPAPGCTGGQICDTSTNTCGPCSMSTDCASGSVCALGACVVGDCVTSSDCSGGTMGQVCGVAMANECGACTTDAQCAGDPVYAGANAVFCISGLCTTAPSGPNICSTTGTPETCTSSTNGDICCAGACVADTGPVNDSSGNAITRCCGAGKQNCAMGETCVDNYCSACAQVPTTGTGADVFYVDPANGNDKGTGINNAGCQFKTLTRAIAAVGAPTAPTTIVLLGDISSGAAFNVQSNVTITGGTAAEVAPPSNTDFTATSRTIHTATTSGAGVIEFNMLKDSALSFLVLDGEVNGTHVVQGVSGLVVQGNGRTGVVLDHVTVQNMSGTGIVVGDSTTSGGKTTNIGGSVTFGAGVASNANGSATVQANGVLVTGTGSVTMDPSIFPSALSGVSNDIGFADNTDRGIAVSGVASIVVKGDATKQDVVSTGNERANLSISQTPGAGLPTNMVTGLVSTGSLAGNGIALSAGSKVVLRGSISLGNAFSGVYITAFEGLGAAADNDLSTLDLGSAASPGGNTFQSPASAKGDLASNKNAGICVDLSAAPTTTLSAEGNTFVANANGASVTCVAPTASVLSSTTGGCVAPPTVTVPLSIGVTSLVKLTAVDVKSCKTK
jgi:hypothetical protein